VRIVAMTHARTCARVHTRTRTHAHNSTQVRTDAGVDKYALTFDIPSGGKGWLLLAGVAYVGISFRSCRDRSQ